MHNPKGIKFITRLRLGQSHLCQHKFKQLSRYTKHTIFRSSDNIKTAINHLFHCSNYCNRRLTILNKLRSIDSKISKESDSKIRQILLFCKSSLNGKEFTSLFNATIELILATKRF